jgi:diguanylate cyclase
VASKSGRHRAGLTEPGRRDPRYRPLRLTAATAGAGLVLSMLLSIGGMLSEPASQAVDDVGQLLAGTTAAGCCWWSWRRSVPPDRTWRLLLVIGTAGWTCGQAIWSYYQVFAHEELPSPSLADVGYFMLPLLALPALWTYPVRVIPRRLGGLLRSPASGRPFPRPVFVLDTLIVVGSLFLLTWATSLGAAVHARGGAALPAFLVALGYPVTDLMLVVFVVLVGRFRLPRNPGALALFGLGTVCISVSDGFFLYLVSTGAEKMPPLYNIGFLVGPVLIGLSALVPEPIPGPGDPASRRGSERGLVLLPYLPLAATGLLVTGQVIAGFRIDPVETFVGLGLVALVVLRQFVTLLDNTRLLRQVRESEDLLRAQAFYDSLTGLANRALFRDRLDDAVVERPPGSPQLGLIFCDLDDFKLVNDGLGHAAGDELLRVVADRLRGCVHPIDTVARLGGDEFALLLESGLEPPEVIGERILTSLLQPFRLRDRADGVGASARIGASVGVAVLDPFEHGVTPDVLMARVDAAMYAAKRRGKNQVVTFHADLAAVSSGLIGDLRALLSNDSDQSDRADVAELGEIDLMYQPVVRFRTGHIVALEALVRWRHPRHGLLPATSLLAAAEDAGMLGALEERVLEIACRDVEGLRQQPAMRSLSVHVNVSGHRTTDSRLVATVHEALLRHGLPGEALVLEITETNPVTDMVVAAQVLDRIRDLDVRLALDDFGAGFSGLSYLLQLPIDIVKLDRSLTVAPLGSRAAAVRNAAATLTLGLGLQLIAEGVETPAQASHLIDLGCELGQGFLYARPTPLPELMYAGATG